MEGGAWWATVHGVAKSQTRLSNFISLQYSHLIELQTSRPFYSFLFKMQTLFAKKIFDNSFSTTKHIIHTCSLYEREFVIMVK